jgi:uncharacterized RDD family membrane protein YckC
METDILADIVEQPATASIGQRIAAALADFVMLIIIAFVFGYFWGTQYDDSGTVGYRLQGWPAFAVFAIDFCLMPLSEGLTGQTLGKRLAGIKVVKLNGGVMTVGASIVRHLFDVVDMFFLCGIIVAATNPKRQRVGDLVAGTGVVRKLASPH